MTSYKTTAVFDETTLPAGFRREHRTKAGAWGIIRLLEGELRLLFADGREELLSPQRLGLVRPQETHRVEPVGAMRMQVEFHDREPDLN
ncbi:MAG TPA: DUF1971 domain-containing protein [Sphingomicrobium sp.]|nr:DUF1971 domain-containing protein [Sphingomicrobium sp.]